MSNRYYPVPIHTFVLTQEVKAACGEQIDPLRERAIGMGMTGKFRAENTIEQSYSPPLEGAAEGILDQDQAPPGTKHAKALAQDGRLIGSPDVVQHGDEEHGVEGDGAKRQADAVGEAIELADEAQVGDVGAYDGAGEAVEGRG